MLGLAASSMSASKRCSPGCDVLLRVAVEPGAVSDWRRSLTRAEAASSQRRLVKYLMMNGALYFESAREATAFLREARESSPETQLGSIWEAGYKAMKDGRWRVTSDDVDLKLASPRARPRKRVRDGPERITIGRFVEAESYQRLVDIEAAGTARARSSREDVWATWLRPLADHYRDVTVFDAYLGRWFLDSAASGIAAIQWLIDKVGGLQSPHRLTLITQCARQDPGEMAEAVRAGILLPTHGGLTHVTVIVGSRGGPTGALALAGEMSSDLHDRHIRFSGGTQLEGAILVGAGLDRLGRDPLRAGINLQFRRDFFGAEKHWVDDLRVKERAVSEADPGARIDIEPPGGR